MKIYYTRHPCNLAYTILETELFKLTPDMEQSCKILQHFMDEHKFHISCRFRNVLDRQLNPEGKLHFLRVLIGPRPTLIHTQDAQPIEYQIAHLCFDFLINQDSEQKAHILKTLQDLLPHLTPQTS